MAKLEEHNHLSSQNHTFLPQPTFHRKPILAAFYHMTMEKLGLLVLQSITITPSQQKMQTKTRSLKVWDTETYPHIIPSSDSPLQLT